MADTLKEGFVVSDNFTEDWLFGAPTALFLDKEVSSVSLIDTARLTNGSTVAVSDINGEVGRSFTVTITDESGQRVTSKSITIGSERTGNPEVRALSNGNFVVTATDHDRDRDVRANSGCRGQHADQRASHRQQRDDRSQHRAHGRGSA
ncbi:hypothetical protein K7H20_08445 [Salipiger manganoxidans]|uniref:hypothetical protein n=1 Tax=Salipiger marinus TaxID=555512 RepID=UPI001E46F11E|nr:hypothetical protein [Salipiger manganoxidans]MCD1618077.1 hypothetical protein [Salipiger manganoxidans]